MLHFYENALFKNPHFLLLQLHNFNLQLHKVRQIHAYFKPCLAPFSMCGYLENMDCEMLECWNAGMLECRDAFAKTYITNYMQTSSFYLIWVH